MYGYLIELVYGNGASNNSDSIFTPDENEARRYVAEQNARIQEEQKHKHKTQRDWYRYTTIKTI